MYCIFVEGRLDTISIKWHLEQKTKSPAELPSTAYSSALIAMGRNALQAYPATSVELEKALSCVASEVARGTTADAFVRAESEVASSLNLWGKRTAEHLKQTAEQVKSLLVAVAGTADAVGERDQVCTDKLKDLTSRLESLAQLDDIVRMRRSILESATDLKKQVREMVESSALIAAQFKQQIEFYANRLEESEECTRRDSLTRLLNRRGMEDILDRYLVDQRIFSLIMVDLDHFKRVNDEYGHVAGDDLLRKFAEELRFASRTTDVLARWGGDEFIMLLEGPPGDVKTMVERIQKTATGEYSIAVGGTTRKIQVQASFGIADHRSGETVVETIARADKAMYNGKTGARR